MLSPKTILLIIALVLFILAAIGWPPQNRVNLTAAGLGCWVLSILIPV